MTAGTFVAATLWGTAALLLACAYLIGVRRRMGLISGYDANRVHDEAGLARHVARWLCIMALMLGVLGIGFLVASSSTEVVVLVMVAVVANLGCVIGMVAGSSRYQR